MEIWLRGCRKVGGGRVTCLAAECLTYFFSSRRQPDDDLFSFPRRYSLSERRVMAKGCGFIFYQLKKERNLFLRHIMRIIHIYITVSGTHIIIDFPMSYCFAIHHFYTTTNPLIFTLRSQIQVSFTSFSLLFSIYYIHYILYCRTFGCCFIIIIFPFGPRTV